MLRNRRGTILRRPRGRLVPDVTIARGLVKPGLQHIVPAPQPPVPAGRLSGLEALRGIAAAAVVLYHAARHVGRNLGAPLLVHATQFGHAGVDLFFVLSGFVILFVHGRDVGRPARWRHYAFRRFSRVMPVYWVALAVTMAMSAAGGHAWPPALGIAWSVALLPSWTEPILGVAWTLQYEVVFYAIFGVLIMDRRAGLALLGCWLAGIVLAWAGLLTWARDVPPQLFNACDAEFFFGMASAWYLARSTVRRPRMLLAAGASLFAAAALAEDAGVLDGYAASARLAYGVPSVMLIMGVVECERSGLLTVAGWLRALGGASYAIYLFQFVFIGLVWKAWLSAPAGLHGSVLGIYVLLVGAALIGGVAASRLVERPLLRLVRGAASSPFVQKTTKKLLF